MRRSLTSTVAAFGMVVFMLSLGASPGLALSFTGNYFVLSNGHPDTLGGIDDVIIPGLVTSSLSGGLPIYTGLVPPSGPPAKDGGSGAITDLGAGNAIQWWTTHSTVSVDTSVGAGTGVRSDAFVGNTLGGPGFASDFYPNNAGNNASGYRAVHWTGAFHVGQDGATISLSADDDAWLFLNGALSLDNGGVKNLSSNTTTGSLATGNYLVDLFFADRHTVQSGIAFSCVGCLDSAPDPSPEASPEPATLLLFGTTLAGLGVILRRRLSS